MTMSDQIDAPVAEPQGQAPPYELYEKLGVPQSQCGNFKKYFLLPKIEPGFLSRTTSRTVKYSPV
jgi:hypothetical protein